MLNSEQWEQNKKTFQISYKPRLTATAMYLTPSTINMKLFSHVKAMQPRTHAFSPSEMLNSSLL